MKWFSFSRRNLVHYGALHMAQWYLDNPGPRVEQDLATSGMSRADLHGKKLIVDFRAEGQCDKVIGNLITYLQTLPVKDILVVFNAVVNVDCLSYKALSQPTFLANFAGWFDQLDASNVATNIDTKFLCLMRRPSMSRARLAAGLMDISSIRLSFGSMGANNITNEYREIIPRELPLLLDGIVERSTGLEHDQTNSMFKTCMFNIVAESGSQSDVGVWRSHFISEKTFKAFGLRQIPIWFAVPGLVAEVRKLGFDMFDDIVTHSYDSITDEDQRLESVLKEIHRLDQLTLGQCQQLKQQLSSRIDSNYVLLKQYVSDVDAWYGRLETEFDKNDS